MRREVGEAGIRRQCAGLERGLYPESFFPFLMSRTWTALLILLALILLVFAGPRASVDLNWDEVAVVEPVDEWLAGQEAAFDDIQPGKEKGIVWADTSKGKTDYAVIYIHGFSASRLEAHPFPDSLAAALGANLHYTRLEGHGRGGDALGEATGAGWMQSLAEAVRVGEAIGDSLVVIGLSTGAALVTAASADPELSRRWAAQVLISPYYAAQDERSEMLLWPWGNVLLSIMASEDRSWEPQNDLHAYMGTHTYPSKVLLELVATAEAARNTDLSNVDVPTLWIYSPDDTVVRPEIGLEVYRSIGAARKDTFVVRRSLDKNNHVIVGDALGPANTVPVAERTATWLMSL